MNRSDINFRLPRVDARWPPASFECLPTEISKATYKILAAPFFIRNLSVEDEITCVFDGDGYVSDWKHEIKSDRSVLWVHYGELTNWLPIKAEVLRTRCNVEILSAYKLCTIDVPPDVALGRLDGILEPFIRDGGVVVYPSLRHPES